MLLEIVAELAILALLVGCGYAGIRAYVGLRQPRFAALLSRRRLAILGSLMLLVVCGKLLEDVLSGESGPVDKSLLLFIHATFPAWLGPFFSAVTVGASAVVLIPVTLVASALFASVGRQFEATLTLASLGFAAALVYGVKAAAARARPALWDTEWYWGSSFPSGHTLHTAAVSTALALCAARMAPRWGNWAMAAALAWTALVGVSRLVLGVHWPTDVLAAIGLGCLAALSVAMVMELRAEGAAPGRTP